MLSIKPDKSRAVLIGTSEFPRDPENLSPLPAVENNVKDFGKLLQNKKVIGIPRQYTLVLLNEETPSHVGEELVRTAREAEDTLIVYYAGHGLLGQSSLQLYLATKNSTQAEAEWNALPFENIKKAIRSSSAKKKILILDCCFSGRALEMMSSESSLLQSQLDIKGTYAIASAPANQPALAPKGERYTTFSGEFLRVLREGVDSDKDELTLNEIYEHIRDESRRSGWPEPQRANLQDADKLAFARNQRRLFAAESQPLVEGRPPQRTRKEEASHQAEAERKQEEKRKAEEEERQRAEREAKRKAKAKERRRAKAAAARKANEEAERLKQECKEREARAREAKRGPLQAPAMVVIPAGVFQMGDLEGSDAEKPVHEVRIAKPFAMSKYPVTFEDYDRFADETGRDLPSDEGWGRGNRPTINVSWDNAVAYCEWLSRETGGCYRLPTEAEWEYAARAGTKTAYWWGKKIGHNRANCLDCGSQWDGKQTAPVGSFAANPFGLYDMAGNAWEWVQDCWYLGYQGAPDDGSANEQEGYPARVVRGGAFYSAATELRSGSRDNLFFLQTSAPSRASIARIARRWFGKTIKAMEGIDPVTSPYTGGSGCIGFRLAQDIE